MKKIDFEGEIYYISNGKVYDEHFLETSLEISKKITSEYFRGIDYKKLNEEQFVTFLRELKNSEQFNFCIDCIIYGLEKFSDSKNYCTTVLPMLTSCYRGIGQPQKAIDYFNANRSLLFDYLSVPLLTSIAASYCDVGDYEKAKRFANRAYAMQGGSANYKNELSLVYMRIKRESNNNY